jgi:hypothetical protein
MAVNFLFGGVAGGLLGSLSQESCFKAHSIRRLSLRLHLPHFVAAAAACSSCCLLLLLPQPPPALLPTPILHDASDDAAAASFGFLPSICSKPSNADPHSSHLRLMMPAPQHQPHAAARARVILLLRLKPRSRQPHTRRWHNFKRIPNVHHSNSRLSAVLSTSASRDSTWRQH